MEIGQAGRRATFDLRTATKIAEWTEPDDIDSRTRMLGGQRIAYTTGGPTLRTDDNDTLVVLDARTGRQLMSTAALSTWSDIDHSEDEGLLLARARMPGAPGIEDALVMWDLTDGRLLSVMGGTHTRPLSTPKEAFLYEQSAGGQSVYVWTRRNGRAVALEAARPDESGRMTLSPDGTSVVAAIGVDALHLWDARSGAFAKSFGGHMGLVLQFSPDGRHVAVDLAGELVLIDVRERRIVATAGRVQLIEEDSESVGPVSHLDTSLLFSPDGSVLATLVEGDEHVRLWEIRSGRLVAELTGHHGPIESFRFLSDGAHVITTGQRDDTLRLWDVPR